MACILRLMTSTLRIIGNPERISQHTSCVTGRGLGPSSLIQWLFTLTSGQALKLFVGVVVCFGRVGVGGVRACVCLCGSLGLSCLPCLGCLCRVSLKCGAAPPRLRDFRFDVRFDFRFDFRLQRRATGAIVSQREPDPVAELLGRALGAVDKHQGHLGQRLLLCLRPTSLLRLSLLRFVDSKFAGNSLWT